MPRKASVPPVQERRSTANPMHRMDPAMLELLVCPQTRMPLEHDEDAGELVSRKARLAYPVRDGIPILLVSEARTLDE